MLKIKDVSYDICTRGPAIAHPVISIDFESVENSDNNEEKLIDVLKKKTEEKGLSNAYSHALDWKQEVYFLFKGDIFSPENIECYRELFTDISREAAIHQKDLLDQGVINVGMLRPPFFMWEGIPKRFTGKESAYDDFNVPYVVIDEETEYSPVALQQIMNHPNGTTFIRWKNEEKSAAFIEEVREMFHGFKCFVLASKDKFEEAKKFCLENGYALYIEY